MLKIISGGQTGVDRAALDLALELKLPCGGYCPKGRKAEDGVIPAKYPLQETDSADYEPRTEKNVEESDGSLILSVGKLLTGGTEFTALSAKKQNKPLFVVDLEHPPKKSEFHDWLHQFMIKTLNVAGPRESNSHGIHQKAHKLLKSWFL